MDLIKHYLPQIFIGLGLILTFLGGLLTFNRTNDFKNKLNNSTEEIRKLESDNIKLSNDNNQLINQNIAISESNVELVKKNIELSNSIQKQSIEMTNRVTGGEGFCRLMFVEITDGVFQPTVDSDEKYTMYDINIQITDVSMKELPSFASIKEHSYHLNEIIPNTGEMIGDPIDLRNREFANYKIFFAARNGLFFQQLVLRKGKDGWLQASRVTRNDKVIFESSIEGLPPEFKNDGLWNF